MAAYLVPSLVKLRSEINAKWPKRDKRSDGWIGNRAHQATKSEHNPDGKGAVHAIDVDKDGINVKALLREVIGDPRVWYVIWKGVIYSRTHGWRGRKYLGKNSHDEHMHISTRLTANAEKDVGRWFELKPPGPKPPRKHAPGSREIKRGMSGEDVKYVQKFIGAARAGDADGHFGAKTEAGVRWYQKLRGLAPVGVVGPKTWAQMGVKKK